MSDREITTTADSVGAAITQHSEEILAPIRQAYEEERETLVREHRTVELAVFDALEELRKGPTPGQWTRRG